MKLSELKTGEKSVIVKVLGHGSFRKRIIEMGFIRGKEIEVLQNAPLRDPVKYRVMGYEVSLRHDEADMIEVVSPNEINVDDITAKTQGDSDNTVELSTLTEKDIQEERERTAKHVALKQHRTINVALVGNPNCGKTSLFNYASGAHERVGNYSGVTVEAKEGFADYKGYRINLTDLPGTYSLSAYSPEEIYVRRQIIDNTPDVIINVLDASNLERNLYLTTQLVDMNQRMVCALNMYDELEKRGDKLDHQLLGSLLGITIIPTRFNSGAGVNELFDAVIRVYEEESIASKEKKPLYRHVHLSHGPVLEDFY